MVITIIILSLVLVTAGVAIKNLTVKVEKYEDITVDQTE